MARNYVIPTRYRRVMFRSRLEARWAVFFDRLQIQWEYEPESFRLPKTKTQKQEIYLPDFRICLGGAVYVEVKPKGVKSDKALRLMQTVHSPVLFAMGPPDDWLPIIVPPCSPLLKHYATAVIKCGDVMAPSIPFMSYLGHWMKHVTPEMVEAAIEDAVSERFGS